MEKLPLHKLYEALLAALDTKPAEDGTLMYHTGTSEVPILIPIARGDEIDDLPLVLPTPEELSTSEDGTTIKFHPYSEAAHGNLSEVQNRLSILMAGKVCLSMQRLIKNLALISTDYQSPDKYSTRLMQLIKAAPSVKTDKAAKAVLGYVEKVMNAHTSIAGERPLVKINLGRKVRDDVDGCRWCEWTFPNPIDEDEKRIFGVKAPNKDSFYTVAEIYRIVVGEAFSNGRGYLMGVDTRTAPSFQVSLMSLLAVANHINKLVKIIGKHADRDALIDTSWDGLLDDPNELVKEIRAKFEGNIGRNTNKAVDLKTSNKGQAAPTSVKRTESTVSRREFDEKPIDTGVASSMANSISDSRRQARHKARNTSPQQSSSYDDVEPAPKKSRDVDSKINLNASPRRQEDTHASRDSGRGRSNLNLNTGGRMIELYDADDEPVCSRTGVILQVTEDEYPEQAFLIRRDSRGQICYGENGFPELDTISKREAYELSRGHLGSVNRDSRDRRPPMNPRMEADSRDRRPGRPMRRESGRSRAPAARPQRRTQHDRYSRY